MVRAWPPPRARRDTGARLALPRHTGHVSPSHSPPSTPYPPAYPLTPSSLSRADPFMWGMMWPYMMYMPYMWYNPYMWMWYWPMMWY